MSALPLILPMMLGNALQGSSILRAVVNGKFQGKQARGGAVE